MSSWVTVASHTCVVRPRWWGVASQEMAPSRAVPRKLLFSSIVVNPERYYLGRWTQQWLYLRQCAHVNEGHPIATEGLRGLRIRDEEEADCWAARHLMQGTKKLSTRTLYSIERDMERVVKEDRWDEVLPGPQRRISLSSCLK